jgi:DNA polymerase-3 subunit beta
MELTVDQPSLGRALRLTGRAAPSRASLPILQNALLSAEPGQLTLAATDLEFGLTTTVAADVAVAGRAAIPVRLLAEYVGQLPPESVWLTLEPTSRRLKVQCGRFSANLAGADPDEFPAFPPAEDETALELDAVTLRGAIGRVAFAAARDGSRPVLSAVLFELGEHGLTLAASDGYRLARARLAAAAGDHHLLIPARAVAEFGRLFAEGEAARLRLAREGRGVYLDLRGTTLYAGLIAGRFPDVERLVPSEWRTRVTVDAADFRQAVRMARLFGGGAARPVAVEAAEGRLRLHARGDETGEAESVLPAAVEGQPQAVALNTVLLSDLLEVAEGPQLELSWTSPQAPVMVRQPGKGDPADLWMVMPVWDAALVRREARAA